jgi:hypothetical protein
MLSSGGSAQTGLSFRAIIQTMKGRLSFRYVQDARRTHAAVAERPVFSAHRPAGVDVERSSPTATMDVVIGGFRHSALTPPAARP